MERNNRKSEFEQRFETYSGNRFEICYDIYTGLMSNDESDRIELLSYACKNFGIKDSDGSFSPCGSGISKSEISDLKDEYHPETMFADIESNQSVTILNQ